MVTNMVCKGSNPDLPWFKLWLVIVFSNGLMSWFQSWSIMVPSVPAMVFLHNVAAHNVNVTGRVCYLT